MQTLTLLALLAAAPYSLAAQDDMLGKVQWLVGCWERTVANRRAVEKWFAPQHGVMPGTSQLIAGRDARETEELRIRESSAGLVYEAHPAGQQRAQFRARELTSTMAVFTNPEHDFPQQITYSLTGTDSLVARIEGDRAGRRGPRTYRFRRADCPDVVLPPATIARLALEPRYREAQRLEEGVFEGHLDWFADNAGPGYAQVRWASPGSQVGVRGDTALRRLAQMLRDANASYRPRDRRYILSVERILVRGDTADVLVGAVRTWRMVDDSARFGPAGAEHERAESQRWIDTWVRQGAEWRLRWTHLFFEEVLFDGQVTVRDGRPLPGGTP